jgi:hypothetical protein
MAGYPQAGWLQVGCLHAGVKVTDTWDPATTDLQTRIAERYRVFEQQVQQFDMLQPGGGPLPLVTDVLARWWKVRVPNFYKEAAWQLTLDGHPTAARMRQSPGALPSCCRACGVATPGSAHHFGRVLWLKR